MVVSHPQKNPDQLPQRGLQDQLVPPDISVQGTVLADHLGRREHAPPLKAVVLFSEAALEPQQVQHVLDSLMVLRRAQRHVDFLNDALVSRILRQDVEGQLVGVEERRPVEVLRGLGLEHDPLFPEDELVDIAVIGHIRPAQLIHRIGKHRQSHRGSGVQVVHDVHPVQDKAPLRPAGVHRLRDLPEARHLRRVQALQAVSLRVEKKVFDPISAVRPVVHLKIQQVAVAPPLDTGKGTVRHPPVLPAHRQDSLRREEVDADFSVGHPGDICRGPQRRLVLLHAVGHQEEAVLPQDSVHEALFPLSLHTDAHPLVHQQVGPVLADLLRHAEARPAAEDALLAVVDPVTVKVPHIPLVPASPERKQLLCPAVTSVWKAQFTQLPINLFSHFAPPGRQSAQGETAGTVLAVCGQTEEPSLCLPLYLPNSSRP